MGARLRTGILVAVILAMFVAVGGLLGAYLLGDWLSGLFVALGISLVFNLGSYFLCDKFVLWSNGAKLVRPEEYPRFAQIVDSLVPQFGLVSPRLAVMDTPTPNAFATGRNARHAIVAVTTGILHLLDDRELTGVLAHELAHIKDRDILVMTFAATLAGAISYASQMVLFNSMFGGGNNRNGDTGFIALIAAITAPIAAMMVQLAISRSRESRADEVGARTIGDPLALASALSKLERGNEIRPMAQGSPATASLFIVNPFRGARLSSLFSTHPPLEVRIRALRAMANDFSYRPRVSSPRSARFVSRPAPP
jgi:heat shock protein HtpX